MPILINFSHPLSPETKQQIFQSIADVEIRAVVVQINHDLSMASQISKIVDSTALSGDEWRNDLYVIMPGYAPAATVLLAAIAGRHGRLPFLVALRPVPGATPMRYELADAVDLEAFSKQQNLYQTAVNDGREDATADYSEYSESKDREEIASFCQDKVREVEKKSGELSAIDYKKSYIAGYMEKTAQLEQERPKKIN
ncbi:CRISPR-associated protein Csx15 [Tengunoibacter tsumagoiensis]|uniref:Uncharacterized protein n=1 Tax=Tengunoibacter tsumagoiensis TaxID=2014871 RepID=A0A402A566_9CHLR|nr:CRISPR-associated protein Csx15 [Tengunoibacter tsumagoiensis]GCE14209.1 hypothetical protein KTT_40680 [Tengunoibacter tsumagoiensis]GCE14263.1 hypothetical protein KTT_41220 [Tengunoibacter tsumagoiensis]